MASNNYIYKMSNAGGMSTLTRYTDMLAGNAVWNPWEPAGAYESIAAVTVPSGGVASITFSSIPQNYAHLQIRGTAKDSSGGESAIFASFNGSNGNGHALYASGSIIGSYQETQGMAIGLTPTTGSGASVFSAAVADILDYSSTTKFKTTRALSGTERDVAGGNSYVFLQSSLWQSTSAVTSIALRINNGSNFVQNTQFALYGIKG